MDTKQRIEEAIRIASGLASGDPPDTTAPIILKQLEYLKQAYERDGSLKSIPKGKMTIGVIAAKEYDTAEPRLAELLHDISWEIEHGG